MEDLTDDQPSNVTRLPNPGSVLTPERLQRAAEVEMKLRGLADAIQRGQIMPDRAIVLIEDGGAMTVHLAGPQPSTAHMVGVLAMASAGVQRSGSAPAVSTRR